MKIMIAIGGLLLSLLGASQEAFAQKVSLRIATDDQETYPFYMGDKVIREKDPGISVEIIKMLEETLEVTIQFVRVPWTRALKGMGENRYDGAFNASFQEERMQLGKYPWKDGQVDISRRLATVRHVFYKMDTNPAIWDGSKLLDYQGNVGVVYHYSIAKDLEALNIPIDVAKDPELNLEKFLNGRFGILVEEESKMDRMLAKNPKKHANIVKLARAFKVKATYLMLSHQFVKTHPELAEQIWDTIGNLNNSVRINRLYQHYYLTY